MTQRHMPCLYRTYLCVSGRRLLENRTVKHDTPKQLRAGSLWCCRSVGSGWRPLQR